MTIEWVDEILRLRLNTQTHRVKQIMKGRVALWCKHWIIRTILFWIWLLVKWVTYNHWSRSCGLGLLLKNQGLVMMLTPYNYSAHRHLQAKIFKLEWNCLLNLELKIGMKDNRTCWSCCFLHQWIRRGEYQILTPERPLFFFFFIDVDIYNYVHLLWLRNILDDHFIFHNY